MTAANAVGWVDVFSFYAFDVPVSGTQRYDSTKSRERWSIRVEQGEGGGGLS
jgi:hypothetical protein